MEGSIFFLHRYQLGGFRVRESDVRHISLKIGLEVEPAGNHDPGEQGDGHRHGQRGHGRLAPAPSPAAFHPGTRPRLDRPVLQPTLQIRRQRRPILVSLGGILLEALERDRLQVTRNRAIELAWTGGLVIDHLLKQHPGPAPKRQLTGQQLVEDHPQRVNIAAAIDPEPFPTGLFRRHVSRGAEHFPFHGHGNLAGLPLGQPKVHDPRFVLPGEHDVCRFQVPVDNAVVVRMREGPGNRHAELDRCTLREGIGRDLISQRDSVHEVADNKKLILLTTDLMHGNDIGVVQLRHRARLTEELFLVCGRGVPLAW